MPDDLARHRSQIDRIDATLVDLLNERAELARVIGSLKGEGPIYNPEREAEVLRAVASKGKGPLSGESLTKIYTEVISACRALERDLQVSYLGPEGTFSEMAVGKNFGAAVKGIPCASIDEVFRKAETGHAHYALVPVENSTEGAIGRTLDLLLTTPLRICAEVVLRVRQNIMTTNGTLDGIEKVYSHPQSLGQCNGWLLQNLPQAERVPLSSNAEAARRASLEQNVAAIGPEIASTRYGLKIVHAGIEDDSRNMTRFLVLGNQDTRSTGRDRTSLVMTTPNQPGAVHALITPFAENGVSMSRIESRPARTGQWEYYFYVDLEGHQLDPAVAKAIAQVKARAPFMKIFGSYPIGDTNSAT
ncbi:MAG: prephenate dehydratase [Burkholderiales bacterium]